MQLAVLGTGYVGLSAAVCLATRGHRVKALDVRADVVEALNRGVPHIHEAGLPELLSRALRRGRFSAHMATPRELDGCELVLIAVGTPPRDGRIDLEQLEEAARFVGGHLRTHEEFLAVIVKSTVVPGTTDTFVRGILEETSGKKLGAFGLGANPEFLREGSAVADFMSPDRLVLGHEDPETLARLQELYASWACDKIVVNARTAELIKYAANALLATQISAVNELANVAAALGGIDILDVMQGVHADRRWSPITGSGERIRPEILSYLVPGCGFGGSCIPKDLQALSALARDLDVPTPALRGVLDTNDAQASQVSVGLERQIGGLANRRVLVLGLAFKPGTDDVRESTSLRIVRDLHARGARVLAHDPVAVAAARGELDGVPVTYVDDWQAELEGVDAVVLATQWRDYDALMSDDLSPRLAGKVVFDARRALQRDRLPGAAYLAVGLPAGKNGHGSPSNPAPR